MKKFQFLLFGGFILCILSGCLILSRYQGHEVQNYTEDYAQNYHKELSWTFGMDYKISDKKEKVIEAIPCDCGVSEPEIHYYEWEITYTDKEGKSHKVKMHNRTDWREQKIDWIRERLEKYYSDRIMNCVTRYDKEVSDVYASIYEIDGIYSGGQSKVLDQAESQMKIWKEQWFQKQNEEHLAFSLYDMDYMNIFQEFPMYINVDIALQKLGKVREHELREVLSELNEETGKTINIYIQADSEYDEDFLRQYAILRGNEVRMEWEEMQWKVYQLHRGWYFG